MAKQSNGKKKARIYYERLVSASPVVFEKVQRTTSKKARRGF